MARFSPSLSKVRLTPVSAFIFCASRTCRKVLTHVTANTATSAATNERRRQRETIEVVSILFRTRARSCLRLIHRGLEKCHLQSQRQDSLEKSASRYGYRRRAYRTQYWIVVEDETLTAIDILVVDQLGQSYSLAHKTAYRIHRYGN